MSEPKYELDTDGIPRGQAVLDALVGLLDLERLEDDLFRGVSPAASPVRVFGGQVAAQALIAAGRTVGADRQVHSLHAYFVRPGDPQIPIVFEVDRTRDGHSFSTRRVVAIQRGRPIFTMSSSFQLDQPGPDHAEPMPEVTPPEELPTLPERLAALPEPSGGFWAKVPRAFDMRFLEPPPWMQRQEPRTDARSRVWFKADGVLPDEPLLHVCVLAYLSDLTLLDSVLRSHGYGFGDVGLASLDHAMWFHRPFRIDDWVLYDTWSPSASGARGLGSGRFFSRDGRMLATVVQEGMIRVPHHSE